MTVHTTHTTPIRRPPRLSRRLRPVQVRVAFLVLVVILAFLGLAARLWYLQIYMGDELRQRSIVTITHVIPTRSPRGDILDRNGLPIADSRQSMSLEIDAGYMRRNPYLLLRLAPILHTTPDQLAATLAGDRASPSDSVRIADNLPAEVVAQVEEQRLYLAGASIQPNPVRHYPMGTAATHLLGYLSLIDARELKALAPYRYRAGDYVGKTGVERQYNALLRGTDGGREVEVGPSGQIKRVIREIDPHPGQTLILSIDRRVQAAAQAALAAEGGKRGAAVALDPRTGEVLALASFPTYDISRFATHRPADLWSRLSKDRDQPLLDRAIGAQYPPASTFKPLLASAGLQAGVIGPGTTVYCAAGMYIGREWKHCWRYHGTVDFGRSIADSCDTFFYAAGMRLGIDRIADAAMAFGLGAKTGIDLGPEAPGAVPVAAWRHKHFKRWYLGQTANCSIGQGEIHATPLQMAAAVAAIANGGTLYQPHLLKEAINYEGRTTLRVRPVVRRRVPYAPAVLQRVRDAMRGAVTHGTASIVDLPNVAVAAKTGTAQTRINRANHGWLTCFAPYDHPTIAIAVIVEEGIHGANSGGPVARAMMQAYFTRPAPPSRPAAAARSGPPITPTTPPPAAPAYGLLRGRALPAPPPNASAPNASAPHPPPR